MRSLIPICVSYGDGIGPEIMESVIKILQSAMVPLDIIKINFDNLKKDNNSFDWTEINRSQALLKAPIITPQGEGYKSINVTLRKKLNLYANLRPIESFYPFLSSSYPQINLIIIRENLEDLYSGIEYRQTSNNYEALKLSSIDKCYKIINFAFNLTNSLGRSKITCFSKDNILKFTDGIFHNIFRNTGLQYPHIISDHQIIDIGSANLATSPENFDVIVTSNLYGDIISDIAGKISGSIGLCGSANLGNNYAMFEAVHGAAPDIAGKNIANPSGLLSGAIMMLRYLELFKEADLIENAWKKTLEEGYHTVDIYNKNNSIAKLSTIDFTNKIISNLHSVPKSLKINNIRNFKYKDSNYIVSDIKKNLEGLDIYIDFTTNNPENIVNIILKDIKLINCYIEHISYQGLKLWPVDSNYQSNEKYSHWCLRIKKEKNLLFNKEDIVKIISLLDQYSIDYTKIQKLYSFNNNKSYFEI